MAKHIVEDLCVESCCCWTIYDTLQSTHFSMSLPEYKLPSFVKSWDMRKNGAARWQNVRLHEVMQPKAWNAKKTAVSAKLKI